MHFSYLQLGHLHIPAYGVLAALGLMSALGLSQRTARYAGLAPEAVWNAGMTAILSAFVISRLLLIAFNLRSFLEYPRLVLGLPSLTTFGILLTAIFLLGYIRWRKLPLLPLLDAATPCAAVLWAFLSLGRLLDGTRNGMPRPPGPHASFPADVYPVEVYTFLAASLLCLVLLGTMIRVPRPRYIAGRIAGSGLAASGLAIFFLDFFRLPSDLLPGLWLDPSQIVALAMILTGAALFLR